MIDRVVRKYAPLLGPDHGYLAHSMPASFIATAIENGARPGDEQKAVRRSDPTTTTLYDLCSYKTTSLFTAYYD
jgi:hypothetical protein